MEYGSIEREIHVEAAPEVVYEVVSKPEHLREWWPDDAQLTPVPGAIGSVTFGDPSQSDATVVSVRVVEADPPRRFSFRWVHDAEDVSLSLASLLVTFDLLPADGGTLLRFREEGFREKGWEAAVLEETFRDHEAGWDHFLPRLVAYAADLMSRR
jgi:uncharacterized protein YndB with AHSA1/START domain